MILTGLIYPAPLPPNHSQTGLKTGKDPPKASQKIAALAGTLALESDYLALNAYFGSSCPHDQSLSFLIYKVGLQQRFGEGNGNPLQYSCLDNPMDGGAW